MLTVARGSRDESTAREMTRAEARRMLSGARKRDERVAQLYQAQGSRITRLAYLLTGDRELAKDLAQEAFLRMLRGWKHLRSDQAAGAYLRRTLVNLAKNHYRRQEVEERYSSQHGVVDTQGPPTVDDYDSALWDAIVALPGRQRAAVVFRYFEDLTEEETADLLHTSARAVNSLVSRAMERLRSELGASFDG